MPSTRACGFGDRDALSSFKNRCTARAVTSLFIAKVFFSEWSIHRIWNRWLFRWQLPENGHT